MPAISKKGVHTCWKQAEPVNRAGWGHLEREKLLKEIIPSDLVAKYKVNPGTDVPKRPNFHSAPL